MADQGHNQGVRRAQVDFPAVQPQQFSSPPPPPPPPPSPPPQQQQQAFRPYRGIPGPPPQQQALPAFQPQQAGPIALTGDQHRPPVQSDNRQVTRARRQNQEVRARGNRGRGGRHRGRGQPHYQYHNQHHHQPMVLHQAQGAFAPYQQHQQQLPPSSDHCACGLSYSRFWNEFGGCWLQAFCPCGRPFPAVPAAPAALPFQQQAALAPSPPSPPSHTPAVRPSLQWRAPGAAGDPRPQPGPPPPKMLLKRKNIRQQTKLAKRVQDVEEKLAAEKAALEEKLAAEKAALEERSQQLKRQVQEAAADDNRP